MSALTDLLATTADHHHDAIAVADDTHTLTYAHLWADAGNLAAALHHTRPRSARVLIALPPGIAWVTALLAIWRTGATAVPLDTTHPHPLLARLAAGCAATTVVTPTGEAPAWAAHLPAEAAGAPPAPPPPAPGEDSEACVWHTSGSTGTPKPVQVTHAAIAARAHAMPALAGIGPTDRVAQLAAPTFDAVLWEVLCALTTGARLQIAAPADRIPGPAFTAFLTRHRITAFTCTPTHLAATPFPDLPHLRRIVLGGEILHPAPLRPWLTRHRVANAYGPTEACVDALFDDHVHPHIDPAPIGRPLPGVRAWILDAHDRPVPDGDTGELHLAGEGMATGYLDMPDTTATAFPHLALPDEDRPQRVYRTGDRARALPDGRIVVLGRVDTQLNLGGVRLEPGDVEACATRLSGVRAAVLTCENTRQARPSLVLRVETTTHSPMTVRAHLAANLPPAAVPTTITCHPELARTTHGKLDRTPHPTPPGPAAAPDDPHPPALPEHAAHRWQTWSRTPAANASADFFAAGGDSLAALAFLHDVNSHYGTEITLAQFLADPTPGFLARAITGSRP
ncbi:non-ribosomal peptide synthetase [Embleya sp. NPDC008237]|uniref:non-ribosomal peptide synthetase n=1 Tax=Embleya sp. NPDC008237 TaxID=3363978 RepID=UPI0036E8E3FC